MPQFTTLKGSAFHDKKWIHPGSYTFAATDAWVSIVAQEIPQAALAMPLAFIQSEDRFALVAVQGLTQGNNVWVDGSGQWTGNYIPARYRGYPFLLVPTEHGKHVLCIDEKATVPEHAKGEPLFEGAHQLSTSVQRVLKFLQQVEADMPRTERICASLQSHDMLEPWPITLQIAGAEQKVEGLFRINERKLHQSDGATLKSLQQSGVLTVAYCQLLSMQHLVTIGQKMQKTLKAQELESQSDVIHFGSSI